MIGFSVEGSTDRAFLTGLQRRWRPNIKLIEGSFRGSSGLSLRREVPKICKELSIKGAEVFVFLTDANDQDWREVKTRESRLIPSEYEQLTVYGVADRNVECWLAADREYLSGRLNLDPSQLNIPDPKDVIERALGISGFFKAEEIASLVAEGPLRNWIVRSKSFADFYDDSRALSLQLNSPIPNERER